jgi:crotonobetainyl-CoA:carnitine CoA-transferase CaiB-like acyl-CoA transferase
MDDIDFMKEIIEAWTLDLDVDEILEMCAAIRIPAAPIGNGATLPQMEHLVAREVFRTSPGGFLQPRPPYLIEHSAQRPLGPAPALDADADATFGPREQPSGAGASGVDAARPLDGLKVVDLTAFWAGPLASSFLADMGADVVKIESAQRPDGMRFAGAVPNAEMWEWSPVFHGANPGKRDLTLNLDDERGLALLKKLIAGADVLIENFSARVLENFGLDWPSVHALNPGLIMVRMPAFGLDGPWRDRPGFAMTVEQMSGLAWMTGYADMPLVPRGSCDPIGGMHTIFALLLALDERERDGRGRLVEVPLVEVAINIAAEQVLEHSAYGQLLEREENRSPLAAPQGLYPCIGSEQTPETLAIAVADDAQWQAWVTLMDAPEWARSPRFATHADRRRHADELDAHLREWTRTQPVEALQDALHQRGIAAERVVNARRLMPHPQLEHRGFFQTLSHPRTGDTRYPGWPLVWSQLPRALHRRPAPTLGEHNREILREELGLSDEEIEALRSDAVIGERPTFM